jgi:hypothetical protein
MIEVRATRSAREGRRWLGLAALAATAVLIPAALALACSPQAYLTMGQGSYAPGDTVKVSGSFFVKDTPITVSLDRTGQSVTVQSSSNGSFQTTFALPASAPTGGYSVQAIGFENGQVIAGLPAKASFVVAPVTTAQTAPASTPSTSSAPQASQSAPAASAPAATATSRPAARPAGKPSSEFSEPRVFSEPNVSKSTTRSSTATKPAGARTQRTSVNGRAVFGGSVAPATTASAIAPSTSAAVAAAPARSAKASRSSSSRASSATSPQAAEQTATEDVWSAQTAGSSPSVLPVAGDGVSVSGQRAGSQLALGIVLLGAGMMALMGGLVAGEARRRRVRAR